MHEMILRLWVYMIGYFVVTLHTKTIINAHWLLFDYVHLSIQCQVKVMFKFSISIIITTFQHSANSWHLLVFIQWGLGTTERSRSWYWNDIYHSRLSHLGKQNIVELAGMLERIDPSQTPTLNVCDFCVCSNFQVETHIDASFSG